MLSSSFKRGCFGHSFVRHSDLWLHEKFKDECYNFFKANSSLFQTAYDQTMPIVAAQLLFTIGVTVALAYELPDKPVYRITQEIKNNLQKRLHPSSTAAPATANITAGQKRIDYDSNNLMYIDNNKDTYYGMMNKHKYYYGNSTSVPANNTNENDVVSKKIVKT